MIDFLRRRFFPREDFIDFLGDGAMLSPNVQSVKLIFSPGSVGLRLPAPFPRHTKPPKAETLNQASFNGGNGAVGRISD